jgi:Zn-dependent M28 family amino/carboxypeptidase
MVAVSYRPVAETKIADSEMVFVGYGINAPERGWNDYKGVDVKGKTVIILINDPDYEAKDLKGPFEGRAMTYYGRWTYKFEEAARQGAVCPSSEVLGQWGFGFSGGLGSSGVDI